MTAGRSAPPSRPPRRRKALGRPAALLALAVLIFLAGLAVGQALEDTPPPGGTQTLIRTLPPLEPSSVPTRATFQKVAVLGSFRADGVSRSGRGPASPER